MQISLVVLNHIWNSLIWGAAVPFSLHTRYCKSVHQNIYWEGIDIFRGHNRKLKCGKMAVNSLFPRWEILCLGNTELSVSPPGQGWTDIVGGWIFARGGRGREEEENLIRKRK